MEDIIQIIQYNVLSTAALVIEDKVSIKGRVSKKRRINKVFKCIKMKPVKEICPTPTMQKVQEGELIVDVRNRSGVESVTFDVPNYMNIPIIELEERINEIPKDKEIVRVCRSGSRSLRTTYYLMNFGYENVNNMRDGVIKWASKGFPTKGNINELLDSGSCDCSQPNCC